MPHAHFTLVDWLTLAAYLVATTVLGARLAGKQATLRDFFLAGRKMPWWAVAGSIIATEVSAVTFIVVPAIVFKPGGNLTYLQFAIGAVLARVIIAAWFVPAYYQREIYSPYDYIGARLGEPARRMTTGLFMLGAVLSQGVRVLLTALILEQIAGVPLSASIWIIGAVAVAWTWLGGMTTVIWTDVIQFVVFVLGLGAALAFALHELPGGWSDVVAVAGDAGKLKMFDTSAALDRPFTIWAALIANTLLCLNAYGADQMTAQRIFCCRGTREARLAMIASSIGVVLAGVAACVGLALFAYYQHVPLPETAAASIAERSERVFPYFIVTAMPAGLTGLILAAVFAAAISSLDSVLAALSQAVVMTFGDRAATTSQDSQRAARMVWMSRLAVVLWAAALCGMAHLAAELLDPYGDILQLALAMASFVGGGLLAALLLALLPLRADWRVIVWSAPLSVVGVWFISWQWGGVIAWPWNVPIGFLLAFVPGWIGALAAPRDEPCNDSAPA